MSVRYEVPRSDAPVEIPPANIEYPKISSELHSGEGLIHLLEARHWRGNPCSRYDSIGAALDVDIPAHAPDPNAAALLVGLRVRGAPDKSRTLKEKRGTSCRDRTANHAGYGRGGRSDRPQICY